MRHLLILALAAPLFVACNTGGGTGVPPLTDSAGNPDRALRDSQRRVGPSAGGGVATVTGQMGDGGGRPTIERGPATGPGIGCPPGTTVVAIPTTRGDRPETVCR